MIIGKHFTENFGHFLNGVNFKFKKQQLVLSITNLYMLIYIMVEQS